MTAQRLCRQLIVLPVALPLLGPFCVSAGVLLLLELASLPEPEWLAQVSAVHQDILHAEQHPYLQRYTCLSQEERQLVNMCLVPDANARLKVDRVFATCDYFVLEGLTFDANEWSDAVAFMHDSGAITGQVLHKA